MPHARHAQPPLRAVRQAKLWDRLLTAAAFIGVVTLTLTIGAQVSGFQPLVVRSGSMEPTIATGSMVLVQDIPLSRIRPGRVVSVVRPDGTRVMHRVLTVQHQERTAVLTLKGDANSDPDPDPVVVEDADELVWAVPSVGRAAAFLASAKGGFVLGCLITAIAMTTLRRRGAEE